MAVATSKLFFQSGKAQYLQKIPDDQNTFVISAIQAFPRCALRQGKTNTTPSKWMAAAYQR